MRLLVTRGCGFIASDCNRPLPGCSRAELGTVDPANGAGNPASLSRNRGWWEPLLKKA